MRAQQFAKRSQFSVEQCRRYGIHAQTARQIEDTFRQILNLAELHLRPSRDELADVAEAHDPDAEEHEAAEAPSTESGDEPLLKCILAGFVDQLAIRRDTGTLECDLTEGRHGTLMRESVVQESPLLVAASIREVSGRTGPLTLLGLATAVKREWLEELFPQHLTATVEHLYDRTHKRVAAVKLVRFLDLVIDHEHQSETDPAAAGRCLADAAARGWIELPKFGHDAKQFRARVNLLHRALPALELPPLDAAALTRCLARAFHGLTLAKEAQATPVDEAVRRHLPPEQLPWLDELAPVWISLPDGKRVKLTYPEADDDPEALPELHLKITDCFALREHPSIGEGKIPVKLWLQAPDAKRIEATTNWPAWRERNYPKLRAALKAKFPAVLWP
jgi:ATP-dependent helicase HrpB